jgi:hypothetical protein
MPAKSGLLLSMHTFAEAGVWLRIHVRMSTMDARGYRS